MSQTITEGSLPWSQDTFTFTGNNHILQYGYDAAGNVSNDGTLTYTYDDEGRIIAVDSGATASYVYDADGLRVHRVGSEGPEDYAYDLAGHAVTTILPGGSAQRREVYAGSLHVATYDDLTTFFDHADWQATERVRSNVSGVSVETCSNLPYGDDQSCAGSNPTPTHFTGKLRDPETGLDYSQARYYSSNAGRWMLPDWRAVPEPVPYADMSNPQSLNLYTYVGNNPIGGIDADGHNVTQTNSGQPCGSYGAAPNIRGQSSGAGMAQVPCSSPAAAAAQQQYGRQPDGSYKADPAKVQKAIDAKTPIGNGQCVTACSQLSGVTPHTDSWTPGTQATGLNDTTDKGLAIASFGPNGKFTQPGGDQNSAIYMGHNAAGQIMVVDQWPPPNAQKYNAPFEHPLANYGATGLDSHGDYHSYENNAYYYHVIVVP